MLYRFVCWFVQHDHDIAEQVVYTCIIVNGDPDKLLYTAAITMLVDNQEVCRCHDIFSAACAMFASYYMFDICYPAALDNIFLFLDSTCQLFRFFGGIIPLFTPNSTITVKSQSKFIEA